MKNNYLITKACAFSFAVLCLFSCSEEQTNVEPTTQSVLSNEPNAELLSGDLTVSSLGSLLTDNADYSLFNSLFEEAVEPSPCRSSDSEYRDWSNSKRLGWTFSDLNNFNAAARNQIEANYLIFIEDANSEQYFGYDGEYTDVMYATLNALNAFWDIPSEDIRMLGMHSIRTDIEKITELFVYFGNSEENARVIAQAYYDAFAKDIFDNGDHPLFTANAFALSREDLEYDYITMGDGIMKGFEEIGYGDIAPQAILAHEYGHLIQFEHDYFNNQFDDAVESTRYTELMADAYSAYFLTHNQGQGIDAKKVSEFSDVFFNIGDCSFSIAGHHGTLLQRQKASQFGMKLAKANQRRGLILSSTEFYDMFNRVYNTLL